MWSAVSLWPGSRVEPNWLAAHIKDADFSPNRRLMSSCMAAIGAPSLPFTCPISNNKNSPHFSLTTTYFLGLCIPTANKHVKRFKIKPTVGQLLTFWPHASWSHTLADTTRLIYKELFYIDTLHQQYGYQINTQWLNFIMCTTTKRKDIIETMCGARCNIYRTSIMNMNFAILTSLK